VNQKESRSIYAHNNCNNHINRRYLTYYTNPAYNNNKNKLDGENIQKFILNKSSIGGVITLLIYDNKTITI
jgi:isocitrate lyase